MKAEGKINLYRERYRLIFSKYSDKSGEIQGGEYERQKDSYCG